LAGLSTYFPVQFLRDRVCMSLHLYKRHFTTDNFINKKRNKDFCVLHFSQNISSHLLMSLWSVDDYNPQSHKYVCIKITNQTLNLILTLILTKNPTGKQQAILLVKLSTKYRYMPYVSRWIHTRHVVAPSVLL